jgi:RNA polymerase sigma-70 factor, ECF subfamily
MATRELTLATFGREASGRALLDEIMQRHERNVLRLCWRLLGNLEDAQDAAQDVFLKVWKNLDRMDMVRDTSPWLYSIAVNVCRDRLRQRRPVLSLEAAEPVDRGLDAESIIARQQHVKVLARALEHLPERERTAMVLRDLEGLPTAEVARILGSSETTVRSQISTGRVKLKKFVEQWLRSRK